MKISEQLRKSILQDAIQGKLTEQLESDGNAFELLEQIKAEKEQLIKDKKIKKEKPLKPITDDEVPFDIPDNWEWIRLGDVGSFKKGPFGSALTKSMFVKKSKNSVKVYEQKNAIRKDWLLGDYYITNEYFEKMKGFIVEPGDIIVSCAGTIGEVYRLPEEASLGIINQALRRVKLFPSFDFEYFKLIFNNILEILYNEANGTAIKNIPSFEILKNILIPLPPRTEQERIIRKVDELQKEITLLNEQEEIAEKADMQLPEKLRKSFLQYAMQGKLTEQLESDGNAFELLEQIKAEKEQLIKDKKIKKEKPLEPITEDEIPFDIPDNWEWVRFGELVSIKTGATFKKTDSIGYGTNNSTRILRGGNITNNSITMFDNDIFLKNELVNDDIILRKGDMITPSVTSLENVGKIALSNESYTDVACGGFVYLIRTAISNETVIKYLFYSLQNSNSVQYMKENTKKSGQAFYNLGVERFRGLILPLPPLAEQQRIVEKLDEIMNEIDKIH